MTAAGAIRLLIQIFLIFYVHEILIGTGNTANPLMYRAGGLVTHPVRDFLLDVALHMELQDFTVPFADTALRKGADLHLRKNILLKLAPWTCGIENFVLRYLIQREGTSSAVMVPLSYKVCLDIFCYCFTDIGLYRCLACPFLPTLPFFAGLKRWIIRCFEWE